MQVLAATQTPGEAGMNWFQGTADAVRQFIWVFEVSAYFSLWGAYLKEGDNGHNQINLFFWLFILMLTFFFTQIGCEE